MKRCYACKKDKPRKAFNRNARTKDGLQERCRQCSSEWNAANYVVNGDKIRRAVNERCRQRIAHVNRLKSKPCADCGVEFSPVCMDFDHLGDDKTDGISKMVRENKPMALIEAEIAKCEVVCACCHRLRTEERSRPVKKIKLRLVA